MVPHANNGRTQDDMLPPAHLQQREAHRQQRKSDLNLLSTPLQPLHADLRLFRHWPVIAAFGLVAIFIIVLFWDVPGAGAAPRGEAPASARSQVEAKHPDPRIVRIVSVRTLDEGMYAVELANGDQLLVSPQTTKTPAPKVGAARKPHNLLLIQGTAKYTIGAIIYHEDQR